MILLLRAGLVASDREAALATVHQVARAHGAVLRDIPAGHTPHPQRALEVVLEASEDPKAVKVALQAIPVVETLLTSEQPYWEVARRGRSRRHLQLGPACFGRQSLAAIAGPCSVESPEQLIPLAKAVAAAGATALRGGAFKPRTSPYAFQGLGQPGLELLAEARRQTGLPIVTEVLDTRDVELVAEHADMLQIGSRNMMNYALLSAAGRAGKPVLLKRGMSATLTEFLLAAEYVATAGCPDILLCERGLRHFDPAVRNLLDLSAVPALQAQTHLPVVVDPSHGTGRHDLVAPMMAAAAAAGADGLMVEVHPQPRQAWSDAGQALDPKAFGQALHQVEAVLAAGGRRLARLPASKATPSEVTEGAAQTQVSESGDGSQDRAELAC
ncbi:MAG: 3-deoxy-7-phosphoheptulonate synthase [Planctomycetota bacterium]|nr:MAG: 3-deoxy-7-phosphoheptulonate synthase [Planctomycetota bacterium]